MSTSPMMPSDVTPRVSWFDRFAEWAALGASRALFFAWCVSITLAWIIEGVVRVLAGSGWGYFLNNTYQLQINTLTTVLTFLMVALLQNSQTRQNNATQHKLNAIAGGLADVLEAGTKAERQRAAEELRKAVGLELRESA